MEARRLVHYEVHVQRGARWTIELTSAEEDLACDRARLLLRQPEVEGIKVWKEVYDQASGRSAGRIVLAETRPRPAGRWRFGRWTRPPPEEPEPEPETYVRRKMAPPPPTRSNWPVAACSIVGGCAALAGLAILAAIG